MKGNFPTVSRILPSPMQSSHTDLSSPCLAHSVSSQLRACMAAHLSPAVLGTLMPVSTQPWPAQPVYNIEGGTLNRGCADAGRSHSVVFHFFR